MKNAIIVFKKGKMYKKFQNCEFTGDNNLIIIEKDGKLIRFNVKKGWSWLLSCKKVN